MSKGPRSLTDLPFKLGDKVLFHVMDHPEEGQRMGVVYRIDRAKSPGGQTIVMVEERVDSETARICYARPEDVLLAPKEDVLLAPKEEGVFNTDPNLLAYTFKTGDRVVFTRHREPVSFTHTGTIRRVLDSYSVEVVDDADLSVSFLGVERIRPIRDEEARVNLAESLGQALRDAFDKVGEVAEPQNLFKGPWICLDNEKSHLEVGRSHSGGLYFVAGGEIVGEMDAVEAKQFIRTLHAMWGE